MGKDGKMIIPWQTLYGTDDMSDMRDMIAPIHRLIKKLGKIVLKEMKESL